MKRINITAIDGNVYTNLVDGFCIYNNTFELMNEQGRTIKTFFIDKIICYEIIDENREYLDFFNGKAKVL